MKLQLAVLFTCLTSSYGTVTKKTALQTAAAGCSCSGEVVDKYLGFEVDAQGRAFESGDTPSKLPYGATVVGQRRQKGRVGPPTENDLVIFNTEVPTGMDFDLAVDGEMKVLILHENDDKSDPDDAQ